MIRFLSIALPLTIVLLAVFGVLAGALDLEPRAGSVIRLALWEQPQVPAGLVLGAWMMEACGLLALFLVTQGRCGSWWLDGLIAGWLGWVFRGPLLVLTVVVATRQPQEPWWRLAFAWWILYSVIGLALGWVAQEPSEQPEHVSAEGSDEEAYEEAYEETVTLMEPALIEPALIEPTSPVEGSALDASSETVSSTDSEELNEPDR